MWVLAGYREEMPDDTGDSSLIWIQVVSLESEVKVPQSCPTLCNPLDYMVHGFL